MAPGFDLGTQERMWMRLGCGMGHTHSRAIIGTAFAISERMLAPLLTPPWLRASRLASRALFRLAPDRPDEYWHRGAVVEKCRILGPLLSFEFD